MKQTNYFNYSRRSRWLLPVVMLFALLTSANPAWGDEVTICDDTSSNSYVPLYGNWADAAQQNQMIYPSDKLTSLVGKQITEMVFYLKSIGSYGQGIGDWTVSMGTTEATTLTGLDTTTPLTQVYSGNLTHNNTTDKQIIITFSTPFVYTGSNLLIEFNHPTPNSYKDYSFYGEVAAEGSAYTYNAQRSFLPKVKFTYETPASGPSLAVYDGSTKLTSGYSYNFGLATSTDTKTFTLKNPGTESVTLNIASTNGFGVSPTSTTIAAKGEETLTITMADATASGAVTISGEGIDDFVINVSGTLRDPNKNWIDFADGLPDGWTKGSWTITTSGSGTTNNKGYASQTSYTQNRLQGQQLTFTEGEKLYFMAAATSSASSYSPAILKVQKSTDGTNWEDVYTVPSMTTTWEAFEATMPAGTYYIAFYGRYCYVTEIYGGQLPDGANFAIDTDGTTQSLGAVAIGDIAEKKFTITNSGNAALPVTFTDATDFYVAKTIMFTKPNSWSGDKLYMYAWDGSGALIGAWPGQEITEAAQNDMSEWVYTARLPKGATGIKFSDNANHETDNISTEGFKDVIGLWYDGSIHTWKNDNFSVPAKSGDTNGTASFAVRMDTKTAGAKSGNIELAFTALNQKDFTIPVSGVVMPAEATVVDFNDNQLPAGWGNNASNKWSFEDGKAYCKSAAELTTSQLQFSDGDFFVIKATSYDDADNNYIEIYTSTDGSTWGATPIKKFISRSQIPYGSYSTLVVTDIPTSVKYLKFKGFWVRIDDITGLKFSDDAPVLGYYTDEECTAAAAATEAKDFGFVTEAPSAQVYYIKNDGTGTMTLSLGDVPTGFTAALGTTSLSKDAKTTLTIGMDAESKAYHNGDIVVTAKNSSEEPIGTFTVTATGVMIEEGKMNLNFKNAVDQRPAGWTGWNVTTGDNGYIYSGTSSSELLTTTLTAAAGGEKLVITASGDKNSWSYPAELNIYTKTGDAEWSEATNLTSNLLSTSTWYTLAVNVPEGNNLIKFEGKNVYIQRIYGLTAVPVAVMTTTATDIAFGTQTAESTEQTFTISNTGTAELTGLIVTLGKTGEDAEYSVRMTDSEDAEFTGSTLAAGATITVHVKQLFDLEKLGAKSDVLTIAATDQAPVDINLSGTTRDPSALYVDFNSSSEWPAEILEHGANWSVYNYSGSGEARQGNTSTATSLTLTPLTVASTEDKLTFDVAYYSTSSYRELIVSYTTDGGNTWTDYNWGTTEQPVYDLKQNIGYSYDTKTITGIPAGTVVFKFTGKCIKLDNITGDMKVTSAPLMTLTTIEDNISGANLKDDATATYTLANNGNADYVGTVATTNVTAEATGDGVTFAENTLTIPAGKTATITVTSAFAAPYGEKTGSLAITSESWVGDINVNYTATLVDPTDFVEDFENGKPAGWYLDTWTVSDGTAHNLGTAKPMITELVGAEEGRNTLSFDAKLQYDYGYGTYTVSVSTSTDRKNWSDPQEFTLSATSQTFSLDELSDGVYYVKFEAANAAIEEIRGVKKLDLPAYDLYLISSTLPTEEIMPGSDYKATVNVASLVATENVKAELYFGDTMTPIAEKNQEVGSTASTIELTCTAPAAGTYDVYAMISVGNTEVRTATASVTVTDKTELSLTGFTRTSASSATADENNEFTAEFNVTVKNTGSTSFAADEVSVTVTDLDNNPYQTATWTPGETIYLKAGNYTANNANFAIYRWSTDTDQEWAFFTGGTDDIYTASLNGKNNFIICRTNPAVALEDLSFENGVWTQSIDLTADAGVVFENNGYENDKLKLTQSNNFIAGMSATINVSVTAAAGEGGEFKFNVKEDDSDAYWYPTTGDYVSVNVTAAPTIVLNENSSEPFATGSNRKARLTRTFTSTWNTICLPFEVAAGDVESKFGEGALVYAFTDYADGALRFDKMTGDMAASTPYLIYTPNAPAEAIEFTNVSIASTEPGNVENNEVTFQGTYTPIAAGEGSALDGAYGISSDNRIAKGNDKTSMKGFRAYLTGVVNLSGARIAIFDETTGITRIYGADEIFGKDDKVYDLNGRRVETAKKGVYIVNGRKMVVK